MQFLNLDLIKNKKRILGFSTFLILISLLGILYSSFNTSYKKPINLGMDFVGGNELRIERVCEKQCSNISPDSVLENLREVSKNRKILNSIKLQFQNNNKLISIRTPYLSIEESNNLITNLENFLASFINCNINIYNY
jgi:preprotein translocase subunit SecF